MSWYNDNKIYEYKGKFYSEKDRSREVDDAEWGGDLYDLYWDMKKDGICTEETIYHIDGEYGQTWDEAEEMIEEAFEHLVISEEDFRGTVKGGKQ